MPEPDKKTNKKVRKLTNQDTGQEKLDRYKNL